MLGPTQLDATATDPESNTTVPGTFVYTPPSGTVPNASASVPLSVAFTPTDTTDYITPSPLTRYIEVDPDTTTTTLIDVVSPIYYDQIIADVAIEAVTSNGPAPIDGGTIGFYIDGTLTCTLPANVGSECPPPTGVGYNAGTHTVVSTYIPADQNFLTSSSPSQNVVVQPDPTSTALKPSMATSFPSQSITFTAAVTDTYYSPVSGTITFYDGTTVLAAVPATANAATFTTTSLNIGDHSITACFASALNSSGTYNFVNSCSPATQEIVSLPPTVNLTTTLLTSSINPSVLGESVTFTATVATTGAFIGIPTGAISFFDGPNSIGSGILTNGIATLTTSTLAVGLHSITAAYLGNTTDAPSTSAVLAQQVNASLTSAGSGFLMTVSPTTFSVGAGGSTSVAVTILELNNFNQPVQLSCSGLPAEATCTFATSLIPATGGTTPLTISVAAPHNCGSNAPYFTAQGTRTGLPIFAAAVLLFFARRRRVLKGLLLAAVLCILPAISGCGGNCTDLGVKPGTYTFTVTGTASGSSAIPVTTTIPGETISNGTVTQSQTMTMTVTI